MKRRSFLALTAALGGLGAAGSFPRAPKAAEEMFEVTRSTAEGKAMLDDLQYAVMREEATERAGT